MADQIIAFAVMVTALSGVAFYMGVSFGRATVCEWCIAKGIEMGFKTGLLESSKFKIDVNMIGEQK